MFSVCEAEEWMIYMSFVLSCMWVAVWVLSGCCVAESRETLIGMFWSVQNV